MKRSTLIILLLALIGGGLVYYLEVKPGKPRDEEPDTSRTAFKFKREEISSLALTRGGATVNIENENNKWTIKQPISALADETAINALLGDIADAKIERDIKAAADQIKNFGLDNPAVKLEVKLKSGETHRIELGGKDFSGSSVYGKVDGGQDVALMPASLLTSADKSLNDLRDRSVFGATQYEIASLKLSNENGQLALGKENSDWKLTAPVNAAAEESEVGSLLSDLTAAKASEIVSEKADELAKYGLDKPKITATAALTTGGERVLTIVKKDDSYYAKASDRGQIFKVEAALYDKLNVKLDALRSKQVLKINQDDVTRVEIKNPNLKLVAEKKDDKWLAKEPAAKKDKEVTVSRIFSALDTKATEVLDRAPAAAAAKLAKPAVEVRITGKDGKTTVVKVSAADGDNVYLRVEGRSEIYKLGKATLESLSFKLDEVITP